MAVSLYEYHRPREVTVTISVSPDFSGDWVGNGTADDVEINAALIYLNGLGGGEVVLLQGTFQVTAQLVFYPYTTFSGMGWITVLDVTGGFVAITNNATGDSNIVLRNFKLDCTNQSAAPIDTYHGIYFDRVTDSMVERVWVYSTSSTGIWFYNNCVDNIIIKCRVEGSVDSCIRVTAASSRNKIIGNTAINSDEDRGIDIYYDSNQNIVANNTITNCPDGIRIAGAADHLCKHNIVIGNSITSTATASEGIVLDYAEWNVVDGNPIHSMVNRAIDLQGNADWNSISDNNCWESSSTEVIRISGDNNIISENFGYKPAADNPACLIRGDYNKVCDNVFGYVDGYNPCIMIRDGASYNQVLDNTLRDDGVGGNGRGIQVNSASEVENVIIGNRFYNLTRQYLLDSGTGTILPTIKGEFNKWGGGSDGLTPPVINTSPGGIDIDGNDEFCYTDIPLPTEIQQVVRIKIWAYSLFDEADQMRLRIVAHGATGSEQWNLNPIDVPDHPSVDSAIAVNDVVHWMIDANDDAQVGTLAAQDFVELMAVGEVAGNGDCATDALFGGWEIEYV